MVCSNTSQTAHRHEAACSWLVVSAQGAFGQLNEKWTGHVENHHPNSTNVVSGHVAYIQGTLDHSSGGSPGIINENSTISVWFNPWTSCFVIETIETWNMRIEPSMNQASFSCHYGIYGFLTSKRNGHDCWSSVFFVKSWGIWPSSWI